MKRTRHNPEQIVNKLREADALPPAVYAASLGVPPVGAAPLPPARPATGTSFDSLMTRLS